MISSFLICALAPIFAVKGDGTYQESRTQRDNANILESSSDSKHEPAASSLHFDRQHGTVNSKSISRLRGSQFLVFDTSSSDSVASSKIAEDIGFLTASAGDYDFGRYVLEREPHHENTKLRSDSSLDRHVDTDYKPRQKLRRERKKKVKTKSNLDVDIEYLESLLLSKQMKKEKHQRNTKEKKDQKKRHKEDEVSEAVADEALKRFLGSSSDQSYVYTSVPSPSPIANSEEPTIFDVPTLSEYISILSHFIFSCY